VSVFADIGGFVKKHPVPLALGAGAIVLLIVVARSGGSSQAAATSGIDPTEAALAAQSENIQAQLQSQSNQLAGQQQLATTQAQYGLDLATIQSNAQTQQNNTAASVALAQIQQQGATQSQSIAASLQSVQDQVGLAALQTNDALAGLENTNELQGNIAQSTAQEQLGIASLTSGTQIAISNNQTNALIDQINAGVEETGIQASVAKTQSTNNLIGGVIGSIL